jgi:hypothetical protein
MRSQFFLVPIAIVASNPAQAYQYMTLSQAQATLFPGDKFTPRDFTMDITQVAALINATSGSVAGYRIKAWKVSSGGWLFLDQVPGRDDVITYAVAVDGAGKIKGIEILECLPRYEAIRSPEWLAQFVGKQHGADDLVAGIEIISGTSLSSEHIAQGVRRVMAAYALFFSGGPD